jgi:hypothetical protein
MVAEEQVRRIPVTTCRMVYEDRVQQTPVRVCRMEPVQETIRVAHCVEKRVPVTYSCCVPRTVCCRIPVETCCAAPCDACPAAVAPVGECAVPAAAEPTPAVAQPAPSAGALPGPVTEPAKPEEQAPQINPGKMIPVPPPSAREKPAETPRAPATLPGPVTEPAVPSNPPGGRSIYTPSTPGT